MKKRDIQKVPAWLAGVSSENQEIVLSSSLKLVRNIKNLPLPYTANKEQMLEVRERLAVALEVLQNQGYSAWEMDELTELEKDVLYEKHCWSADLMLTTDVMALYTSSDFDTHILLNHQEHIRIRNFAVGLKLQELYPQISLLDDLLEEQVEYAFSNKYGYLTKAIDNVGTGLTASVVLHLPALVGLEKIEKISMGLEKLGLTLTRLYKDDHKHALGNLYVLSNLPNFTENEQEIINKVTGIAKDFVRREKQMRQVLYSKANNVVENYVWRAIGLLKYARKLSAAEMLSLLSYVGIGIDLKIVTTIDWLSLKKLMVQARDGHLRAQYGTKTSADDLRATIVRDVFKEV